MSDHPVSDEERVDPIRVSEVTVAAYRWDDWSITAKRAYRQARRGSAVIAAIVAVGIATGGFILLPGASRLSILVYAPILAWGSWAWSRGLLARRGMESVVEEVRALVVPALTPEATTDALTALVRDGGTLVTNRSTAILVHRRDSVVAIVASEYDLSTVPTAPLRELGFSGGL